MDEMQLAGDEQRKKEAGAARSRLRTLTTVVAVLCGVIAFAATLSTPFVSSDFRVDLTGDDYRRVLGTVAQEMRPNSLGRAVGWLFDRVAPTAVRLAANYLVSAERVNFYNARLHDYATSEGGGGVPTGQFYLVDIVRRLFVGDEYVLALAILCFSIVFPGVKLAACAYCLSPRLSKERRHSVASFVGRFGKWSMADVFIVALIVVFFKAKGFHYEFRVGVGFIAYCVSFAASSVAASLVLASGRPPIPAERVAVKRYSVRLKRVSLSKW